MCVMIEVILPPAVTNGLNPLQTGGISRIGEVGSESKDMESHKFKTVLLDISDQLSEDQLDKLKYLCQDEIGKRRTETIDSGIKLFDALYERGKLGEDNTELLGHLLTQIRRDDLLQKLNTFVNGSTPRHQDDAENGTV